MLRTKNTATAWMEKVKSVISDFGTKSERIYRHFPTITLNRAWERSILLVKQFLSENEIEGVFLEEGCFYL